MGNKQFLGVILAIFFLLTVWFSNSIPYRTPGKLKFQGGAVVQDIGNPDERQHANYIKFLRENKNLPKLDPQDPQLYENYQSHQPPLYYILMAPFGNPTTGSAMLFRLLNGLIGVVTLLGIYHLGAVWWNDEKAGLAAASLGLLPSFVLLHSAISNDPLLFCLLTWIMVWVAKCFSFEGTVPLKYGAIVGGLLGLAFLTKSSSLSITPALVLAVLLLLKNKQVSVKFVGLSIGLAILIALPLWLRNMQVYGDPLAMQAFRNSFGGSAQASTFINGIGAFSYWSDWVLWWTARSAIGVGGYMDIFMPSNLYLIALFLLCLLPILGLLNKAKNTDLVPNEVKLQGQMKWVFGAFILVVFFLFYGFNSTYFQAQARYLFPAFAVIAAWLGRKETQLYQAKFPCIIFILSLGISIYFGSTLALEFSKRVVSL